MKRLLSLFLALCLMLPVAAIAEDAEPTEYTSGDYTYILLEDGTAEITDYDGSAENLTIPSELDGYPVTSIRKTSFFLCSSLTSITIPDSVISIEYSAFHMCRNLTSVTIPDSVTFIEANPFVNCDNLTDIIVSPDHPVFETIDGVLFSKPDKKLVCCPSGFATQSYSIPDGTISIQEFAFYGCHTIVSVSIPDSVTSIGEKAFFYCRKLTSVTIPESVTSIGINPFVGCEALNNIVISPDHPTLATIDGVLFTKPDKKLVCYPLGFSTSSYTIPDGTVTIGDRALTGCDRLNFVTIPDGVTTIEDMAFYACDSLTSVNIPGSVTHIGEDAFRDCDYIKLAVIRGSYAEQWCIDNGYDYIYNADN